MASGSATVESTGTGFGSAFKSPGRRKDAGEKLFEALRPPQPEVQTASIAQQKMTPTRFRFAVIDGAV